MNAILMTMLALGGPSGVAYGLDDDGVYSAACQKCDAGPEADHGHGLGGRGGCLGAMPQSCYNPSLGCYANTRFTHRYPAFHGYYYRSPYNYRHHFDYPWHAGLHEPTSHFSYNVPGQAARENIAPPTPIPAPEAAITKPQTMIRSAQMIEPISSPTPAGPTPAWGRSLRR